MENIKYAANGSVSKVTDYGIGARGTDAIYVSQNGTTTPAYPIYDAHGNMISTLSKQGSCFATSALRTFDAWGDIRLGAQTGDPKGRYCATLGHKQDDESGLTYMRARYYEPGGVRFLSQDPRRNGGNWFIHANNNPVDYSDRTGCIAFGYTDLAVFILDVFAYLVAISKEGDAVLGLEVGGSTPVLVVAVFAGAVLTIVGAIQTVQSLGNAITEIAAGRQAVSFAAGEAVVNALKRSLATSAIGEQLEDALWLNDINSGGD